MLATQDGPLLLRHPQVHVVSGSFGAGHDAAARAIASALAGGGYTSAIHDVVDAYPAGLGRLLRRAYLEQLRHAPASWGALLDGLERPGPLSRASFRAITMASGRLEPLADEGPALIISTHPFASQALGHLRQAGRLRIPVVTYLTDMSVHPLWIHPGVDLHLALHPVPATQARAFGARTAVVESAMTRPGPRRGRRRDTEAVSALRSRLGLPLDGDLALVTGGAHGVGDLERSAVDLTASGQVHPVVLCAQNNHLRRALGRRRDVTALGWRDDVPELLTAVDVVVQNAGGFTSQQALEAGVPQISYRCLPGHGESNAAALAAARLVPWARTPGELHRLVRRALHADVVSAVPTPPFDLVELGDLPTLVGLALGVMGEQVPA